MTVDDQSEDTVFQPPQLRTALKRSASALKADRIPFALAGSYALWVHGAPEPEHDVDFVVPEANIEAAAESLRQAGLDVERPPEDWLFKVDVDGALVDVLHRLNGVPVSEELVARSEEYEILGIRLPVLPATDVVLTKLQALTEHYCDFASLLAIARAVREQLDWDLLRDRTAENPFAEAFLFLVERLEISPGG